MKKFLWALSFVASAALLLASYMQWVDFSLLESVGFITGGYSVWLLVTENIWTWPVSIVNAIVFIVLFQETRLFADSGLQIIYIILNISGWYWWLKGGKNGKKKKLSVSHVHAIEAILLGLIAVAGTVGLYYLLVSINDSAPLWDGLATMLSMIATYMAVKKYFESWYVWIAVNLIYIVLYGFKNLPLLTILYVLYLAMTIVGLVDWKKQLKSEQA